MTDPWRPSAAEAALYADYSTEIRSHRQRVHVTVQDGHAVRWLCQILRDPTTRRFRTSAFTGATESEARAVEVWTEQMPRGGWADPRNRWVPSTRVPGAVLVGLGMPVDEGTAFEEMTRELLVADTLDTAR